MKNPNDFNKLVSSAKNGNKKAFDKLYQLTHKEVWFTCVSLMKHEENAKDIFQDTYLTAFEKIGTLEDCENFPCWIKRIAVNKCKDFLKSKVEYQLEEEYLNDFIETDELLIPEKYVTNNEKRKIIIQLMEETLTYVQYQTVFMFYFSNMAVADIAQLMDCSEGTVKSRLSLARTKMKKAITDYEEENNDRLHGVVLLPFFSSVFKTESENLKVPVIKLNLPAVAGKKGFDIFTTGILSTTKSRVIAGVCTLAFVSGMATTAIIFMSGCGVPADEVIVETTEPTETVPEKVYDAVKDNDLKVDEKGNITDSKGNKLEVNKDGEVKVTDSKGNSVYVKPETVKDVVENNGVVSKPSNSTGKGNNSTSNQGTGKKPNGGSGSNLTEATKKPAQKPAENPKPTQKPTQKPADPNAGKTYHDREWIVTKPAVTREEYVEPVTEWVPPVTHEEPIYKTQCVEICNDCGADITEAVTEANRDINSTLLDDHLDSHPNGKNSWHTEYREVQVGTKTVVDKEGYTKTVKEGYTKTVVISEEKGYWREAGWY